MPAIAYPPAPLSSQTDNYHGEIVADPYRDLEDLANPATAAFVRAEDQLTRAVLSSLPGRDAFAGRLRELWQPRSPGVPAEHGGRWFERRREPGRQQDSLFVRDDEDGDDRLLIDGDALSADGSAALAAISVSPQGTFAAYARTSAGSDWLTWRIREVMTRADCADQLIWCKQAAAPWRPDGSGFYYTRLRPPEAGGELTASSRGAEVCWHRLGTSQDADEVILDGSDSDLWLEVAVSADDQYLLVALSAGLGSGQEVRAMALAAPDRGWVTVLPAGRDRQTVVGAAGGELYVRTDAGADRGRVVAIDVAAPAAANWREVIPEKDDVLLEVHQFGGRLVCHYLHDACSRVRVFGLDGAPEPGIAVPPLGTVSGSQATHDAIEGTAASDIVYLATESFTESATLWRHDLSTGRTELARAPAVRLGSGYVTEQVMVRSADGTAVPLFLTRRADLAPGDVPVLLYGYGGAGVPITPWYSAAFGAWVEAGGMLAVASLRGGGEYGRSWYQQGRREAKQNVFDDFCACARWLADSGWSRAERIAINGGSNGGLLVGACLTQHPELFGAVIGEVGLYDMLRFHCFTVGWFWQTEYGSPDDPQEYRWLRAYSPLHNVRPGRFPPVLLLTGDRDDRVIPGHSLKFGAALQAAQQAPAPILIRMDAAGGHGHGKASASAIAEAADWLAFALAAVGG